MEKRIDHRLKSILITLAWPIAVIVIMNIIDITFANTWTIVSSADMKSLFRTIIMTLCYSLALNSNFAMGRMDMSAGSQMYLACILGGNLALQLNLGGIGVLLFSVIVGAMAGGLVGFLFVKLRILPMILGLGLALIYECFAFAYDQSGLMLFGKNGVGILSSIGFIATCAIVVIIVVTYLFQNSLFGYRRRAISGNQRLAGDFGINIYSNCIGCYVLGGCLVAVAGVFQTAYSGTLTPLLDLGTKSTVFNYMFPMMFGIWLGNICTNSAFGVLCASVSVSFIKFGISKFGFDANLQSLILAVLWLLFMVYSLNWPRVAYLRQRKLRKQEALEYKQKVLDTSLTIR